MGCARFYVLSRTRNPISALSRTTFAKLFASVRKTPKKKRKATRQFSKELCETKCEQKQQRHHSVSINVKFSELATSIVRVLLAYCSGMAPVLLLTLFRVLFGNALRNPGRPRRKPTQSPNKDGHKPSTIPAHTRTIHVMFMNTMLFTTISSELF
jgi:hypothetical protein